MRGLTEAELNLAPDWATHYYFYNSDALSIVFENEVRFQSYCVKTGVFSCIGVRQSRTSKRAKQVPKKHFDIAEHEFLESDIQLAEIVGGKLRLHLMSGDLPYVDQSKKDAIAIAKAMGVTAKDLS